MIEVHRLKPSYNIHHSVSCYEVSSPELSHLGFNLPKYHRESSAVIRNWTWAVHLKIITSLSSQGVR